MPVSKKVAKGWVFLLENKSVTTNKTTVDVDAYYYYYYYYYYSKKLRSRELSRSFQNSFVRPGYSKIPSHKKFCRFLSVELFSDAFFFSSHVSGIFCTTVPVISLELGRRFSQKKNFFKIMTILTDTVSTCSENFEAPSQRIEGLISSFQNTLLPTFNLKPSARNSKGMAGVSLNMMPRTSTHFERGFD